MRGLRRIGLITILIGSCTGLFEPELDQEPEPYRCTPHAADTVSRRWPDSLTLVLGSADRAGVDRAVEDGCSYQSLAIPGLTIAPRDSTVATTTPEGTTAQVVPVAPGRTWLLFEAESVLDSISIAVPDTFTLGAVDAIAAGGDLTCAMEDDGRVMCWGGDNSSVLGPYGDPYIGTCFGLPCSPMPKNIGLEATDAVLDFGGACFIGPSGTTCRNGGTDEHWASPVFTEVTQGSGHRCALTGAGEAYCWGGNHMGQLGTGETGEYFDQPQQILAPDTWTGIDAAYESTCGVAVGGVYCWGILPDGIQAPQTCQVSGGIKGSGPTYAPCSNTPLRIPVGPDLGGDTLLVDIAGRCFLTSAGGVLCLEGSDLRRAAGPGTFVTLEAGRNHGCGLTAAGTARCWGENYAGQLGTGDFAFSENPVIVSGGHRFIDLALGASHTCGLTDERVVLCWGEPAVGQAGVSILTNNLTVPTRVRGQGTP